MPYPAGHKERVRERIVDSARRLFNRHGFEQTSIDQIMSEAGLTRGGFYHHFKSKDELYAAAVRSIRSCSLFAKELAITPPDVIENPRSLARMLVDLYLSDAVLENEDLQCPLYALPSDVARAGLKPRKAYTELVRGMAQVYRAALGKKPDAEQRANAIVSLCVGGMVLARTTHDPALRRSLRAATHRQALEMLGA